MAHHWEFLLPTRVQFGRGGLKRVGELAKEFGSRVFLVGYRDRSGLEQVYARASEALTGAGLEVSEFYQIPPDPNSELAAEGARQATEANADVVIGLGGGSVIDAAKGIAALAKMGGGVWDYTTANKDHRPVTDALPVVAIPTTAGTGTEVTPVAVFTHDGVGSAPDVPLKASFSSPAIRPKVALVDSDLAVGSPPRLTAACGADALGHAIEACMSRRANPIASVLAMRAVRLIVKNLAAAVERPDDPEPREPLALAALLAGAAFGSAGVVMTHSIAQALGSLLHIPHGEAVAIGTPWNLRYNAAQCVELYCQLAHYCGVAADSPEEQAARFVQHITDLLRSVGLSDRVAVACEDREALAAKLSRNAFESTRVPLTLNPRRIDEDGLKDIILEMLSVT